MAAKSKPPEKLNEIAEIVGEGDEAKKRAMMLKAGIGIGIGSAAIVAALLYSNSARKKKDEG
jgi:hypothetical protein